MQIIVSAHERALVFAALSAVGLGVLGGGCLPRPRSLECAPCAETADCGAALACMAGVCVNAQVGASNCGAPTAPACQACLRSDECGVSSACIKGKCIPANMALSSCLSYAQLLCEDCRGNRACGEGFSCQQGLCIANGRMLSDCRPAVDAGTCAVCTAPSDCGAGFQCGLGRCESVDAGLSECFSASEIECQSCGTNTRCGPGFDCVASPDNAQKSVCNLPASPLRRCILSTGFPSGSANVVSGVQPTVLKAYAYDVGGLDIGYSTLEMGNQQPGQLPGPNTPPIERPGDKIYVFGSLDANGKSDISTMEIREGEWYQYSLSIPKGTYRVEVETNSEYVAQNPRPILFKLRFGEGGVPNADVEFAAPALFPTKTNRDYGWSTTQPGIGLLEVKRDLSNAKLRVVVEESNPKFSLMLLSFRRIRLTPM